MGLPLECMGACAQHLWRRGILTLGSGVPPPTDSHLLHTSVPKSDVESDLFPGSNELSVHVGRSLEEKEPSCVTKTGLFTPPQRCTAQRCSSEKRVGELMQAENLRFSSQKMGGMGWAEEGDTKKKASNYQGAIICAPKLKSLYFLEFHFDIIFSIFALLWNLRTFQPKTTGRQTSLMGFSFWEGKWLDLPKSSYVFPSITVSLWSRLQLRRCSIHNHWATMIRRKITHQHADIMACWFPCETTSHFLWVQSCFIIYDALYHLPIAVPLFFSSGNQEENQTTRLLEPNELQMHVKQYNYRTIALISHTSKIMLKILHARL